MVEVVVVVVVVVAAGVVGVVEEGATSKGSRCPECWHVVEPHVYVNDINTLNIYAPRIRSRFATRGPASECVVPEYLHRTFLSVRTACTSLWSTHAP